MCDSSVEAQVGEYGLSLCIMFFHWSPLLSPFYQVAPNSLVEVKLHSLRKASSNTSCLGLTSMYFVSLYLSLLICNDATQIPIACFCSHSSPSVSCFKVDYNLPTSRNVCPLLSLHIVQYFHKTVF